MTTESSNTTAQRLIDCLRAFLAPDLASSALSVVNGAFRVTMRASQPRDSRSIFRSRSRLTRTSLVTSRPGTTTTSAAQNGGNGNHRFAYRISAHDNAKSAGPVSNAAI